jgi:hypothetical protein
MGELSGYLLLYLSVLSNQASFLDTEASNNLPDDSLSKKTKPRNPSAAISPLLSEAIEG